MLYADRGLRTMHGPVISSDEVDSVFYSHLPYIHRERIYSTLYDTLSAIFPNNSEVSKVLDFVWQHQGIREVLSAKRLLELTKALAALIMMSTRSEKDLHKAIVHELRIRNCLLAKPLLVADTNWVKDYFSFVVSPTTGNLEFWSTDFYGVRGRPISYWKNWMNGSRRNPEWGIFSKPFEYVAK